MLGFPKGRHQILIGSLPHWRQAGQEPCEPIPSPDAGVSVEFFIGWHSAKAPLGHDLHMMEIGSNDDPVENGCLLVSGERPKVFSSQQHIFMLEVPRLKAPMICESFRNECTSRGRLWEAT